MINRIEILWNGLRAEHKNFSYLFDPIFHFKVPNCFV